MAPIRKYRWFQFPGEWAVGMKVVGNKFEKFKADLDSPEL